MNNGYRVYTKAHLHQLQQILVYRELDFSLEQIKQLLNAKDQQLFDTLLQQKRWLIAKRSRLQLMINTIEETMSQLNTTDNFNHLFEGMPKDKAEQWQQHLEQQLEDQSFAHRMQQFAHKLTPEQAKTMNLQSTAISKDMAALLDLPISDNAVQAVVKRHYDMLNTLYSTMLDDFTHLSKRGYSQMAIEFVDNPQMKAARDHFAKGTSEHLSEAMIYFAEQQLD